jgi:hypothetical protein
MNIGIDLEMAHCANSDKRHGGAAGGGGARGELVRDALKKGNGRGPRAFSTAWPL